MMYFNYYSWYHSLNYKLIASFTVSLLDDKVLIKVKQCKTVTIYSTIWDDKKACFLLWYSCYGGCYNASLIVFFVLSLLSPIQVRVYHEFIKERIWLCLIYASNVKSITANIRSVFHWTVNIINSYPKDLRGWCKRSLYIKLFLKILFSLSNPQCDSESDIDDKVRLNFLISCAWKFPDSQNKNEFENNIFLQSSCQI